jgi:beta-glucosidase/6-phospho-beta-glucosidase/beta-galactosidase
MRANLVRPGVLLLGAVLCSCSEPAVFPAGFLFGVATAGFQNDPGCPTLPESECVDKNSDWYEFVSSKVVQTSGRGHLSGDPLGAGPGSYELFAKDFDLVKDALSGNAVRLSLEWSRIFPTSTEGLDGAALRERADGRALAHYHAVFAALRERGLAPLVTLNHYTLPSWIHDAEGCHKDLTTCTRRGWLDRDKIVREISKYAGFVAREFGAEVDRWATLNEPFAVVLPGFIAPSPERTNPPAALFAMAEARAAMSAMIEAHARMYDAVKAADQKDADGDGSAAEVGLVYSLTPAAPRRPDSARDVQGAKNLFYLYNEAFLNAVVRGDVDPMLDGHTVHDPGLAGRMDYLGINYYTRVIVDGTDQPFFPELSPLSTFNPLTSTLFTEYPQGLFDMVRYVNALGLPAYITENGSSDHESPEAAPRYLEGHVAALARALAQGADVRGYFYWTLVDNYEWNHGLQLRFGLFALGDDAKKARTPRPAAAVFQELAQAVTARGRIPRAIEMRHAPAP